MKNRLFSPPNLAVLALLGSATMWGVIWYPLRLLEAQGLAGVWCALLMYGAALCVALPWVWRCRYELLARPWALLALGMVSGWANLAFILAVIDGLVVRVTLLFFLYPLWAILLGRFVLKEHMSVMAWLGFSVALGGALIMLWDAGLGNPLPRSLTDWLALSSGLTFAVAAVIVRGLETSSVVTKTMAVWAGNVAVAALWAVLTAVDPPLAGVSAYLGAVLLGIFGTVVMTLLVQYGIHHVPLYRSSVILLFELIAGAASAYWLAHEVPGLGEWLGGVLIVAGAWLILSRRARAEAA